MASTIHGADKSLEDVFLLPKITQNPTPALEDTPDHDLLW